MDKFELILNQKNAFSIIPDQKGVPKDLAKFDLKKIPFQNSLEILKILAANGSLVFEGKPLLIDLFSKIPFFYEVHKTAQNTLELKGKIELKVPIDLTECQWIAESAPIWFISQNRLKVISTDISYKELEKLPRIIDQDTLEELIEESKEENAPQVKICFEGAIESDPLPRLILSDVRGTFANLSMDYGNGKILPYYLHDLNPLQNRKKSAEAELEKDLLETDYSPKISGNTRYYCPSDKIQKSLKFLLEIGWRVFDSKNREVLLETKRSLFCESDGDQIGLKGSFEFGKAKTDLENVITSFYKKESFIPLSDQLVGLTLDSDPLHELEGVIELIGNAPRIKKANLGLLESENWQGKEEILKPESPKDVPSNTFKGTLRPYQQKGLVWLDSLYQAHFSGILADDMGLGKTVQVLAFLSLRAQGKRHLIVMPTSLLFNWEREIERFLPGTAVYRHHGAFKASQLPESGIILTSFNTLRNDLPLFQSAPWDCIIVDEAQAMKNAESLVAKSLFSLKSAFRLSVTGTIIENHVKELYSHFHFLMPGMLSSTELFALQKTHKIIRPFILRRKKEEVARDLPPLEEQITFVEMEESQKLGYQKFLSRAKQGLIKKIQLEGGKANRLEIFEAILRLRQICSHPQLVPQLFDEPLLESGKMEALFLDIKAIYEEGKKALIFSQFSTMLHLIGKRLTEENIPFCLLEGATQNREEPVKKFQEDPKIPFFLITLKAGGTGLNLTAADYVLIYDPWWHEAAESQAIARAHRIGQLKPVIAKRYITVESIEEKMLTLKRAKSALFKDLLEGDIENNNLTINDLSFLIDLN